MARYIPFPPKELIVPNGERSELTRVSESPVMFSEDFNLVRSLFNIKKNLEILNSLNLYILDVDNDITNIYNSEYVYEIETNSFIVRTYKSFFGLFTSFDITIFNMKRVSYFETKIINDNNNKKFKIHLPFWWGNDYFNVIKHKINSYQVQKELKVKQQEVLDELPTEYNEDDILLLEEIQKVDYDRVIKDTYNNIHSLVKVLVIYLTEEYLRDYGVLLLINYETLKTENYLCFKFKFGLYQKDLEFGQSVKYSTEDYNFIYVDIGHINDDIIYNLTENKTTVNFYFSSKDFKVNSDRFDVDIITKKNLIIMRMLGGGDIIYPANNFYDLYNIELAEYDRPYYAQYPGHTRPPFPYKFLNLASMKMSIEMLIKFRSSKKLYDRDYYSYVENLYVANEFK